LKGIIDLAALKREDRARNVNGLMNYLKVLLSLNEQGMQSAHEIAESHVITLDRYPTRPSINDPDPSQTYPDDPNGSPLNESRSYHLKIEEDKE
jgi:hypothetical protein